MLPRFSHILIRPFDEKQVALFIRRWYEIREWNLRERSERSETLEAAIRANKRIGKLAENPLTLSMIAMVHRKLARLPEERVELYRVLTESLVEHWELQKYKNILPGGNPLATKLLRMEHLAEHMMCLSPGKAEEERTIMLPEKEVKEIFKQVILEKEHSYRNREKDAEQEAENFLHYIKTRTGILMERGRDCYAFVHLSFQEYLTAAYMKRYFIKDWQPFLKRYGVRLGDSRWEETLLLFFEMAAANDPADLDNLVIAILGLKEAPLHLLTGVVRHRPELGEERQKEIVDRLCVNTLDSDPDAMFLFFGFGEPNDWRELIARSYRDPAFAAVGTFCWQSFLQNQPVKTKALRRWAAHFVVCDQWAGDKEKADTFFKKAWNSKKDSYILSCLAAVLPAYSPALQKKIEEELLTSFTSKPENDEPGMIMPFLVFSEFRPGSATGPLAACTDLFMLMALAPDRARARARARAIIDYVYLIEETPAPAARSK